MKPKQWTLIRELFAHARDLPKDEQQSFLRSRCDDQQILKQVTNLLEHDCEDQFLDAPALGDAFTLASTETPEHGMRIPEHLIDGYTITKILGSGASGIVYEAQQDEPKRMVAIKVLRAGSMGEDDRARFSRESETLALLDHPNIATVFSVGTTSDGSPWMAMELVQGQRLDLWMEQQEVDGTIAMMYLISDAIYAAHKQHIVHRDLKPANILVSSNNTPMVLDFGIARITQGRSQHETVTQVGTVIGTQQYMSPEQSQGSPDVQTSSDVFALGVMLREFLPTEAPQDLKTIATKATDEFPSRRYQHAGELRDDLYRWLEHKPIKARAATLPYTVSLWIRRHRVIFALMCVVTIAIIIAAWQTLKVSQANDVASIETKNKLRVQYASFIQQAQLAYARGDLDLMSNTLEQCDELFRGWEWNWLEQLSTSGVLDVQATDVAARHVEQIFAVTQEGALVNALDGTELFRVATPPIRSLISRDCSTWLVLHDDGTLNIYAMDDLEAPPRQIHLQIDSSKVSAIAISDNGHYAILAIATPFDPMEPATLDAQTRIVGLHLLDETIYLDDQLTNRVLDSDAAITVSNNATLAAAMIDGNITVWRFGATIDRREVRVSDGSVIVALDAGGTMLAVSNLQSGVSNIRLLDTSTLAPIDGLPFIAHMRGILSVDIAPDRSVVASIDGGGMLQITPLQGGVASNEPSQERDKGATVRFSSDSLQLLIRREDGQVRVRSIHNNTNEQRVWIDNPITHALITDDAIIATHADGYTRFDLKNNILTAIESVDATEMNVRPPDTRERLVTVSKGGTIRILTDKNKPLLSFTWDGAFIIAAGFTDHGKILIAVSVDGRIRKWTVH